MKILHLDEPGESDVAYETMTFPDGQPHVRLDADTLRGIVGRGGTLEIIARVKSATRVVELGLVLDAARSALEGSDARIGLSLSYLLGARMDRRIAPGQPATLHVLASMLRPALEGLAAFRILDPHSPVALEVFPHAEVIVPDALVVDALLHLRARTAQVPVVVIPDKGAVARTTSILERVGGSQDVARCVKRRDPVTGNLSGFALEEGDVRGRACLIVDDLCDGGGTFSGIASVLREAGATSVSLLVTHGVFSRGIAIPGIDATYCTDSYGVPAGHPGVGEDGFIPYATSEGQAPIAFVRPRFVSRLLRAS